MPGVTEYETSSACPICLQYPTVVVSLLFYTKPNDECYSVHLLCSVIGMTHSTYPLWYEQGYQIYNISEEYLKVLPHL